MVALPDNSHMSSITVRYLNERNEKNLPTVGTFTRVYLFQKNLPIYPPYTGVVEKLYQYNHHVLTRYKNYIDTTNFSLWKSTPDQRA